MTRMLLALPLFALALLAHPAMAHEIAPGNYKLTYVMPTMETTVAIISFEKQDGKLVGKVVATNPRSQIKLTLAGLKTEGHNVRFVLKSPTSETAFDGVLQKDGGTMGVYGTDARLNPAKLTNTDQTELEANSISRPINVPQMQKAQQLSSQPLVLNLQASREKDPEKKAELQKQVREAAANSTTEVPKLYREVIEKHPKSVAAIEAALSLLPGVARDKISVDDAKRFADVAHKASVAYGPKYAGHIATRLAETMVSQEALAKQALEYAKLAEKQLGKNDSTDAQMRVLKVLASAYKKAGSPDQAKDALHQIAKLETILDAEYSAKMPPFKAAPFAGRKAKSDRVVVMELFTGAQCPPCVAADVAFDVLEKSYQPKDLVLLQYHMHIPGPDPLTNSDAESRWAYYRKAHGDGQIRGTPSTLFNGMPKAGGGGGLANAEKKYGDYSGIINELLEQPSPIQLKATAYRQGENIEIKVEAANVPDPEDLHLRIALVEETVRYVGSNKLRFHHQVVRDFPGGAAGMAIKEKSFTHSAKVNLDVLRKKLATYLDEYGAKRAFPTSDRPMEFKNLKVIAFVQNDKTFEILQAVQVDVPGQGSRAASE